MTRADLTALIRWGWANDRAACLIPLIALVGAPALAVILETLP